MEAESSRARAPSPRAAGGDDEIVEEVVEDAEVFDVEDPVHAGNRNYGGPSFLLPQNPIWSTKINYKGNTEEVRRLRAINPRASDKEGGTDYSFWSFFQQDYYESVIIPKTKAISNA